MDIEQYVSEAYPSYVGTALWSSIHYTSETDEQGTHMDDVADVDDISEECRLSFLQDISGFCLENWEIIRHYAPEQVAHDLWLTQNHHGAGFWDGDYPEAIGTILTDSAHVYGSVDLYISDDGKVYC